MPKLTAEKRTASRKTMEMFGSGTIARNSRPATVAIATATVDATIAAPCCDFTVCSHWLLLIIALGRAMRRPYLCILHNPEPDPSRNSASATWLAYHEAVEVGNRHFSVLKRCPV